MKSRQLRCLVSFIKKKIYINNRYCKKLSAGGTAGIFLPCELQASCCGTERVESGRGSARHPVQLDGDL